MSIEEQAEQENRRHTRREQHAHTYDFAICDLRFAICDWRLASGEWRVASGGEAMSGGGVVSGGEAMSGGGVVRGLYRRLEVSVITLPLVL